MARARMRDRFERDVMLAWATEYMARQKELSSKSVKALLAPTRRQRQQDHVLVMQQIAAMYGLKMTVSRRG